jgi:hypothetical protein
MPQPKGAQPAPPQAATVETLKNTPVTLGVVLLLGGVLASGLGAVFWSVESLSRQVEVFRVRTEDDLSQIKEKLQSLHDDASRGVEMRRSPSEAARAAPTAPTSAGSH